MKRYLVFFLMLCCLLTTACGTPAPESSPIGEDIPPSSSANNAEKAPAQAENISSAMMDWGVNLTAENVTSTGLTIRCTQSGGEPTGKLSTGSYYILEQKTNSGWAPVEFASQEGDIAWTMEAWGIPMNGDVTWEVDWVWLYGTLPEDTYRIGKEIMDWRAPGDYDTQMAYAEFDVPELLICDGLPLAPADVSSN